jgi:CBS-domain-containing membrane protein
MDIGVPLVRQDITLQQLVNEYVLRTDRRRMLLAIDGVPLGVIETSAIKAVPRAAWPSTSVRAIARPVAFTCSPETDASDLLARLDEQDQLVPVISEGRVVGGIDAVRLLRLAELRRQLQVPVSSASAA